MDLETFKLVLLITMAAFSIGSFILLYSERKSVRKREVAFKLYDKWSGDKLQEHRTAAWDYFESLEKDVKINKADKKYKAVQLSLLAIEHHIYDTHAACKHDMVDLKILNALFGESMDYHLKKIDNHIVGGVHGDKELYENKIKKLSNYLQIGK